jgi:hypothetical protein
MPEPLLQNKLTCPTCGGELIQKSKIRLIIVGLCLVDSIFVAFFVPLFWVPGVILAVIGIYLLVWAILGKARWCRNCKKFSITQ